MRLSAAIKKTGLIFCIVFLTISLTDCKKKKDSDEDELENSFDKEGMLTNYADALVIPNFQQAKSSLDSLIQAYNAFTQNINEPNLLVVRQKFLAAYIQCQHIWTFEYGQAENELIRINFNTYPADTNQIHTNIASGTYDFALASNLDAKGLPALDFLLFGKNLSNTQVVNLFSSSANRVTYVTNCLNEMQTKLNAVVSSWNSGYRNTFINSKGSEIGSSLGLMVNQLNFEVDLLKNGKIGIPLGKKSAGVIYPEKCEAYYANTISVQLAKECLQNIENTYLGRSKNGADGLGLDDYLDALKVQHTSGTLNAAIKNQFAIAKAKLAALPEPLSAYIVSNPTEVDAAYVEIVKLLVLLKTDMPSAIGIVITYQDGDGD